MSQEDFERLELASTTIKQYDRQHCARWAIAPAQLSETCETDLGLWAGAESCPDCSLLLPIVTLRP
jgi:hypothetical protein